LLIPTGVLTAAYLSRHFGPHGYGLLTLGFALVFWVETNIATALSRPAIKIVSDAEDWHAAGSAVLRLYMLTGFGVGLALWLLSTPLASLMAESALAGYFRLLAIDVPLFCLSQAHRNIIVGLGRFRERAVISAIRWIARLAFVVIFVEVSGSPESAIWGIICVSLVELIVCRFYVRPSLFRRGAFPMRHLFGYALPLVASALCMTLYSRLDLLMLKPFGASTAEAGLYGVAQNISLLPNLFSFVFAPALLSTLSHALRCGDRSTAMRIGEQAMRAVVLLLPLVTLIAGAAPDLTRLIFGPEFLPAVPLLRLLIFGTLALLMIAVTTSVMIAAGKHGWTLLVALPLVVGAFIGHSILIPAAGALGAASVTTIFAIIGAVVTIFLIRKLWRITPSLETLSRCIIVSVLGYIMTAALPGAMWLSLALKLAGAGLFVIATLWLLGELGVKEINAVRVMFQSYANPVIEAQGSAS